MQRCVMHLLKLDFKQTRFKHFIKAMKIMLHTCRRSNVCQNGLINQLIDELIY